MESNAMNIEDLIKQATTKNNTVNIVHYTNLVLTEACWHIKQTPVTSAYTTFDEQVAITQRADCFKSVYNLIIENIKDATPTT
jgi:hypothetical protein